MYARVTKFINWIKNNLGSPNRKLIEERQFNSTIPEPYEFEESYEDSYEDEAEEKEYYEDFTENEYEEDYDVSEYDL